MALHVMARSVHEPANYKAAMNGPHAHLWGPSVQKELKATEKRQAWSIAWLPKGHKLIQVRWKFTPKELADGSLDKAKARIAVKGFSQVCGIHYTETFSPVLKIETFRIICAIAAVRGYELAHVDVVSAFMNSNLEEEIYTECPDGVDLKERGIA